MIKKDLTKVFIDEIYSKPPMRIYPTNKIVDNHIDEIWSIDLADMIAFRTSKDEGFRNVFKKLDNFPNLVSAIPLKNKYGEKMKKEFLNILTKSKRSPIKIKPDQGAEFYNCYYQKIPKSKNFHRNSRFTDKCLSIAEKVIKTIRYLTKKPVFEKGNADWLSELPFVIKQYNETIHHSIKMSPIQAKKKQMKKKSIPIFKIEELDNIQILYWEFWLEFLKLDRFSAKEIVQTKAMRFIQKPRS